MPYPEFIETEAQLEDALSTPFPEDVAAMKALEGDILLLGAGGKMGPSLARLAKRASDAAGVNRRIIAVARFSDAELVEQFEQMGVTPLRADLLKQDDLQGLPEAPNVVYMAAKKFGTSSGAAAETWAMNAYLPGRVAERFPSSRIVAFSTGNVYALSPLSSGGPQEGEALAPVGEYGTSAMARERIFTYFSQKNGTPVSLLRLNYAIDLRYGVLVDLALSLVEGKAIDITMPAVNVIWQRDANSVCLRSFADCATPPYVVNLTGPETLSVRWLAMELAKRLGVEPVFTGQEQSTALLSNASLCQRRYGYPSASPQQLMDWVAHWITSGGKTWTKATKFQVRDGKF